MRNNICRGITGFILISLLIVSWRVFVMNHNVYKPVIETGELAWENVPAADRSEELYSLYRVEEDLLTLTTEYGKGQIKMIDRMDHGSNTTRVAAINRFNRAVRRERTLLITGDLPVFAMAGDWPLVRSDPPMIKLGEFNLAFEIDGIRADVMIADHTTVRHLPEGSEWSVSFYDFPELKVTIRAVIIDENSIAFHVRSSGPAHRIEVQYGQFAMMGRLTDASYFGNVKQWIAKNQIHIKSSGGNAWDFTFDPDSGMREKVGVVGWSTNQCNSKEVDGTLIFTTTERTVNEFAGIAFHSFDGKGYETVREKAKSANTVEQVAEWIEKSGEYYKELIHNAAVRTGSDILDLGFRHAVLNHDYGHVGKGWLEGGHYWACYWANNYQISAAISLGQYEKAREALKFFGMRDGGYSIISASGEGFGNPSVSILGRSPIAFEGLPYYIYQLDQYVRHTGDWELVGKVLPYLDKMADDLYAISDSDGNGVLGWKLHANTFIYQADHLQLPGDGASPTLMMIGMTEYLSRFARETGNVHLSQKYSELSRKGSENLLRELWSQERGMFYSHKDPVGISHTSHYYSDFVFPALYSNLASSYTRSCLDQLIQTLIFRSEKSGLLLMRVGNYKPSMFATDNVMPTQMAEAARALFLEGYTDYAVRLMESVAYGATVYTESPGSFPERQNDQGKGEANFMFGNPYGSYIHTFINGLWGIDVEDNGKKLIFAPKLPREWENGEIRLGYADIAFEGTGDRRTFTIGSRSDTITGIRLDIPVHEGKNARMILNGKDVNTENIPGNGYTRLIWEGLLEEDIVVEILDSAKPAKELTREYQAGDTREGEVYFIPGVYYTYATRKDLMIDLRTRITVHPLPAIHRCEIKQDGEKKVLTGEGMAYEFRSKQMDLSVTVVSVSPHFHTTVQTQVDDKGLFQFHIDLDQPVIDIAKAEIQYTLSLRKRSHTGVVDAPVEGGRNANQVDIRDYLKDEMIQAMTGWRDEPYKVFLHESEQSEYIISSGDFFHAPYKGEEGNSLMAVISRGLSDRWTGQLQISNAADRVSFNIDRRTGSLSILLVSESQARNMFAQAGLLVIRYEDETERRIPLIVGVNMDFLRSSLGTESEPVRLYKGGGSDYAHVLRVGCDAQKTVRSIELVGLASDFYIGVLAINIG
jgi:hypothetical protein